MVLQPVSGRWPDEGLAVRAMPGLALSSGDWRYLDAGGNHTGLASALSGFAGYSKKEHNRLVLWLPVSHGTQDLMHSIAVMQPEGSF